MVTKILCPYCGNKLTEVGEPIGEPGSGSTEVATGHYTTLGPQMEGESVVGSTLSWDCLCNSCGFSFVLQSDLRASDCPLSRATWPEVAEASARASEAEARRVETQLAAYVL